MSTLDAWNATKGKDLEDTIEVKVKTIRYLVKCAIALNNGGDYHYYPSATTTDQELAEEIESWGD